ncbi:hypothetical protein N9A75_00100 [bacterium]|nr:hypothetical protein [bacterium]
MSENNINPTPDKTSPELAGESPPRSLLDFNFRSHIDYALKEFGKKESMYNDLVWFARKPHPNADPEFYEGEYGKVALEVKAELIGKYPDETKEISCPEGGDWTHGFNSGCLAAFRYAARVLEGEYYLFNEAWDFDFPDLNT